MTTTPQIVLAYARQEQGKPIAWKEWPDGWHIVFEDGRKVIFDRANKEPNLSPEEPVILPPENLTDNADGMTKPPRSTKKKGGSEK